MAASTGLRFALDPFIGSGLPFLTYFPAVALAAFVCGRNSAIFAVLLSVVASLYCFLEPRMTWHADTQALGAEVVFVVVSGFLIALVTALRTARETAQREGQRSAMILSSITDAFVAIDRDWRITFINARAEEIARKAGHTPGSIVGKNHWEAFPETKGTIVEREYQRATRDRVAVSFETGDPRLGLWVAINAYPSPEGLTVIFRDISERKSAEENRQRLAAVVESSDDAILTKTIEGRITGWNKGAERMFGYTADEIIGRSVFDVVPPQHADTERDVLARIARGERVDHYETHRKHKDGAVLDVSLTASPLRDAEGKVIGVSSVVRDITAQKKSEEALRHQQEWFSVTLASIGDAVIATDSNCRVSFLNPVAEAMTGWPLKEAAGRPLEEVFVIFNEETREPAPNPVSEVLRKGVIVGLANHTVLRRRDGVETAIEDSAAPIRATSGEILGVVMVFHDVSDRRKDEGDLRAARDAAEAANRAKDLFLAALSHELRTPLTPVLMLAADLARSPEVPAEYRQHFETIRSNVELEARLIDDLLDVTRITTGKLHLNLQACDAHALIRNVLAILRSDIESKGLELKTEFAAEEAQACADPVRLQQVFWNVLKNAVKFTRRGGQVVVRVFQTAGYLKVEVCDTGIGIAAGDLARIFDAFVQAQHAVVAGFGGLGLGLSISALLMREQDGRIWATSEGVGRGATFHIEIPLATPAMLAGPSSAPVPIALDQRYRVLVVEDHEATRNTLCRLLAKRGHEVESAESVAAARAIAQKSAFDVVVSDVGLPDGDGRSLMRELFRDLGTPAIALSGYGTQMDVNLSLEAGFTAHLTKPVDFLALEEAIARALNGPRTADNSVPPE